ncbi:hypothetical protein [Nitratifractor sp.]|uniref:hypothetical protein n=1 Tax=Nitratifractor sp. TaxID=2268144 RepID=UPI0025EBE20F|nr:hypothetical protein [Nitratifractor sp.]
MKKNEAKQRLSVKEYARQHRLSIYQVVKKINSGDLSYETVAENGKEVRYILIDPSETEKEISEGKRENPTENGSGSGLSCAEELHRLREELQQLRLLVERCCKNPA